MIPKGYIFTCVQSVTGAVAEAKVDGRIVRLSAAAFSRVLPLLSIRRSGDGGTARINLDSQLGVFRASPRVPELGEEVMVPVKSVRADGAGFIASHWGLTRQFREVERVHDYVATPGHGSWGVPAFYAFANRPLDVFSGEDVKEQNGIGLFAWRDGASEVSGIPTVRFKELLVCHLYSGLCVRMVNEIHPRSKELIVVQKAIVEGLARPRDARAFYWFHDGRWERCRSLVVSSRYGRPFVGLAGMQSGRLVRNECDAKVPRYFRLADVTGGPNARMFGPVSCCRDRTKMQQAVG